MLGFNLKQTRFWIGTGLSLFLLALAFRGSNLSEVAQVLRRADLRWTALAVLTVLLTAVAKAGRWWLLFFPFHRTIRYRKVVSTTLIGQMVNIVFPARMGEIVRIFLIGEIENLSRARALGTIVIEKFIDVLMVPTALVGLTLMVPLPAWVQESSTWTVSVAGGIAALAFIGLAKRQLVVRLATWSLEWLPHKISHHIVQQLELVLESLEALRNPRVVLTLFSGSVGIWILSATTNYLVFLALGLSLPFSAALFLLVILQLGVAIPSAPGKLGVFHYLCVLGLGVFGVAREPALGYAFLLYAVVFAPLSVAGAIGLWWESLSLRRMQTLLLEFES